jgi:hypothetical protein
MYVCIYAFGNNDNRAMYDTDNPTKAAAVSGDEIDALSFLLQLPRDAICSPVEGDAHTLQSPVCTRNRFTPQGSPSQQSRSVTELTLTSADAAWMGGDDEYEGEHIGVSLGNTEQPQAPTSIPSLLSMLPTGLKDSLATHAMNFTAQAAAVIASQAAAVTSYRPPNTLAQALKVT